MTQIFPAVKFGLHGVNAGPGAAPAAARRLARRAEDLGYDSLWAVDHVVIPSGYQSPYPYDESGKMMGGAEEFDLLDPLAWLTFAAAVTSRIRLATGVLVLPQRNPVVLAKQLASLDVLSEGRAIAGTGVGWLEEEFDAVGVPFRDRGRRHDDYVRTMRALWTETRATIETTYTRLSDAISLPHPVEQSVPIVVGGSGPRSARRAAQLGDGYFPTVQDPGQLEALLTTMRAESERAGRDPDGIEVTVPFPGVVADAAGLESFVKDARRCADLGAHRIVIPVPPDDVLTGLATELGLEGHQ
ncbi:LLM class F420-dependent oxidoreductase [Amycolatopsis jiangsuensis]|uniref:Putative F420-dependent oxidoreductase n=1 Tax=Amycolatopsis jiangsuensis TaxID=1181879 RepID=A0A840IYH3_9PSEU|nr:LLM class F420-dependent oxidoreductase [Amycolatopsis jiangsuensis]MBB4686337.1 putative F420-dependent oxidoreductase [Amycolatopsis jiangsuensis]